MGMRTLAIVPTLCCVAALVLSFLCLFAGSKKGFMEDYAVVTLNTSQIGQNLPLFNDIEGDLSSITKRAPTPTITTAPTTTPAVGLKERGNIESEINSVWSKGTAGVASLYTAATGVIPIPTQAVAAVDWLKSEGHNVTSDLVHEAEHLTHEFENLIEEGIGDFAQVLGVHDFYSAHILTFCEGYYIPGPVPNATVKAGSIHKNVTQCSNTTVMTHFDPAKEISQELNASTDGFINLSNVQWPQDVQNALNALKVAQKAVFVLYCLAIGFIFLALVSSILGVFFNGWMSALINIAIDLLAFLTILVASAMITYIADRVTHFVNKHGDEVGISANRGENFLALTWATTGLVFVSMAVWVWLLVTAARGRKGRRGQEIGEKGRV